MKIKFKKFNKLSRKVVLLCLQISCILAMFGLGMHSGSPTLYQINLSTFIMQTALVIFGEGFLFGGIINQFTS